MIKKILITCFIFQIFSTISFARDFILEFVEENYKESMIEYSNKPLIYHSVQTNSNLGSKLLILTGENVVYRNWLRQFIAHDKSLIAKVPDEMNDVFVASKAFEIDVTLIHPFNHKKWKKTDMFEKTQDLVENKNYILVLDSNRKKNNLIQSVIDNMAGYQASITDDEKQALNSFRKYPQKFKMIITNYMVSNTLSDEFVQEVLKINPAIPVLIETGYKNDKAKEVFKSKFARFSSVHIKSLILDGLQATIKSLIRDKA